VPKSELKKALLRLQADRDARGHQHEIGWADITKPGKNAKPGGKERLATLWLRRLVWEHDLWRFSVLGVDTSRLSMERFGERKGDQLANAYRRFYRSNLKLHVTTLHRGFDAVEIAKAYHDEEGRLEADDWFSWHPHAVIGSRDTVTFRDPSVCFVNSCHVKEQTHPKASHFVQLCDLLVGSMRYIFEANNRNAARDRVAKELIPLAERLNCSRECRNPNSRYQHHGRATLSFFPSRQLEEGELDNEFLRSGSTFFRDRPLRLSEQISGQESLFL
jgi:hypothetical protein